MSEIIVTKNNFENEVLKSETPVLVDFWADWCGPCKMLGPILSEIADEYGSRIKVAKVNVDNEPELALKFNVTSIPMLLYFKDGEIANKSIGYMPKNEIEKLFE